MHVDSRVNAEVDADRILELIYKDSYGTKKFSHCICTTESAQQKWVGKPLHSANLSRTKTGL
jgi:hypothetical protein